MRQVVICQFAIFQHRIDLRQAGLWAVAHGNGHGAIEMDNGRRLNAPGDAEVFAASIADRVEFIAE